jgi:hypothetical protein
MSEAEREKLINHAERLREIAEDAQDEHVKRALLAAAHDFEALAAGKPVDLSTWKLER